LSIFKWTNFNIFFRFYRINKSLFFLEYLYWWYFVNKWFHRCSLCLCSPVLWLRLREHKRMIMKILSDLMYAKSLCEVILSISVRAIDGFHNKFIILYAIAMEELENVLFMERLTRIIRRILSIRCWSCGNSCFFGRIRFPKEKMLHGGGRFISKSIRSCRSYLLSCSCSMMGFELLN